jgi:C_GCAxxG_C_C family probable redox protein
MSSQSASKAAQAVTVFAQGYNCSQAMLMVHGPEYGLAPDLAMRLATALGIGCSRGEQCGAVTGALLVIGLKNGGGGPDGAEDKAFTYHLSREFVRRFTARRGTVTCRDMLGVDPSTAEGLRQARSEGRFTAICHGVITDAAEVLQEVLAIE